MTVSNATRKAGPFIGNGVSTVFPFTFKVFDKTNIQVLKVDGNGISTPLVLDSDYSVLLNPNQDNSPGGQITYPVIGLPLAAGYQLVMLGDLPYDQKTDITNQGGFYPQTIEDMVDRSTIQIQQLEEITSRAIVVSPSESLNPVLPTAQARAGTVLGFDSQGGVTLLPQPSTLGGGNMRTDVFRSANGDFVPGTTRAFTLSRDPGSADNLLVWWDGAPQFDFVLTGTTLTFNDPVDINVTVVRVRIGTTLSVFTPSAGSVGDAALQFGDVLPRCFTSIANLRATNDLRYHVAFVTGYYAPNDGGGGSYIIDTADTTSADNGGSIIVDAAGRRWKLHGPADWYVEQFGAKGDGATDDSGPIQAAINALPNRGGTVRFKGKAYAIASPLTGGTGNAGSTPSTKNGIRLIGEGGGFGTAAPPSTQIFALSTFPTTAWMLSFVGAMSDVTVESISFYCNLRAKGGVFFESVCGILMRRVSIAQYTYNGLTVLGGPAPTGNYNIVNEFHQVICASTANNHIGLLMDGNWAQSNDTWLTQFFTCRFDTVSATNSIAAMFKFVDSSSFHRCHFTGNNTNGVGMAGCYGCYFDSTTANLFPGGLAFYDCSILNTYVNSTAGNQIGVNYFVGYGVFDNETIPTDSHLIGVTAAGHPFGGWGS